MRNALKLLFLSIFALSFLLPFFVQKAKAVESKIIITEIKLGGGNEPKEFVTLYNRTNTEILLSDWKLEYAKPSFDSQFCSSVSWAEHSGSATTLNGSIAPGGVVSFSRSLNDGAAGSLRIIDPDLLVRDVIGWGTEAKCYDSSPAALPVNGKSLQRYIDCETNIPIDTDNNAMDFILSGNPGPNLLSGSVTSDCEAEEPPIEEETQESGLDGNEQLQNSCEGIIISELLPNPSGSDSGNEFIELHNPTGQPISLEGCQLSTSANTKVFIFGQITLNANQYVAFYDTGLTLGNSTGGSVLLINADDSEINQVDYPPNLDDNVSWALVDNSWVETFSPTPDTSNVLLTTKPCPVGEARNPDSGRCINLAVEAAGLTPCKVGQERNPETKRCRSIASLTAVLKACDPGQTRNPETNRCRKASISSLTPCKEGQERNPETNRCRNLSSLSSDDMTDVKDVLAATTADKSSWFLAVGSMAAAFGYAIWEWRNEILQQLFGIRQKLPI